MEFLQSKRLEHADGLSRSILKLYEPSEETVIATLRLEIEIKSVLCNTTRVLPVTIEGVRNKAKVDKSITEKKKQFNHQQYKKINGEKTFSIRYGILIYGERIVIPGVLKKRISKDFHTGRVDIARRKALMRS